MFIKKKWFDAAIDAHVLFSDIPNTSELRAEVCKIPIKPKAKSRRFDTDDEQ